jgi:hypothetical protein
MYICITLKSTVYILEEWFKIKWWCGLESKKIIQLKSYEKEQI